LIAVDVDILGMTIEGILVSQTLGELIRERRLGVGVSLGQLATKAATTAAVVRTWERGEAIPDEDVHPILADLLQVALARIVELAAEASEATVEENAREGTSVEPVLEQAEASLDPVGELPMSPQVVTDPVVFEESSPDDADPGRDTDTPGPLLPGLFSGADPMPAQGTWSLQNEPPPLTIESASRPIGGESLDETTPVMDVDSAIADPDAPRPIPLRYPMSAPTGVAVEIAETEPNVWNPLRYLYDPDKPWLYWIRAVLTVVVLIVLIKILLGSAGELFDKIGEVIDSVESTGNGVIPVDTIP
jgi:transcriptional regulator with XRE-family HTH domain